MQKRWEWAIFECWFLAVFSLSLSISSFSTFLPWVGWCHVYLRCWYFSRLFDFQLVFLLCFMIFSADKLSRVTYSLERLFFSWCLNSLLSSVSNCCFRTCISRFLFKRQVRWSVFHLLRISFIVIWLVKGFIQSMLFFWISAWSSWQFDLWNPLLFKTSLEHQKFTRLHALLKAWLSWRIFAITLQHVEMGEIL